MSATHIASKWNRKITTYRKIDASKPGITSREKGKKLAFS